MGVNGPGPSSATNSEGVNGSWLVEVLAWLADAVVKIATVVWGWLISIFYVVVRFCLNIVDILQMFAEKLVGIEAYNQEGGLGAVEKLEDTDLIIRFITNKSILKTFGTICVLGLILLIIFSIIALVRQNYQAAITDGADGAKKGPREVLKLAGRGIFMCLLVPFLVVFGVLGSNAVLASVCNAIRGDNNLTIGGLIFTSSAYEANKFREYANDGVRVPIVETQATEVVVPLNYQDETDMQVLFYKLASGKVYISAISDDKWFTDNLSFYQGWIDGLDESDIELDAPKLSGSENFKTFKKHFAAWYNNYFDGKETLAELGMFNKIINSIYTSNWTLNKNMVNRTYDFGSTYKSSQRINFGSLKYEGEGDVRPSHYDKTYLADIIVNSSTYIGHESFAPIELEYYVMADMIDFAVEQGVTLYYVNANNDSIKWSNIVLDPDKPEKIIDIKEYNDKYIVAETSAGVGNKVYACEAYTDQSLTAHGGTLQEYAKDRTGGTLVADSAFIVRYYNGFNRLYWSEIDATSEETGATYIICYKNDAGRYIPVTQETTKFSSRFLAEDYTGPVVARGIFQSEGVIPKDYCLPTAIVEQIVDDYGNELHGIEKISPFAITDTTPASEADGLSKISGFMGTLADLTGSYALTAIEKLFGAASDLKTQWEDKIRDNLVAELDEDDVKDGNRTGNVLINPNIEGYSYSYDNGPSAPATHVTFYDYNGRKMSAGGNYINSEDNRFSLNGASKFNKKHYLVLQMTTFNDVVIPWYFADGESLSSIISAITQNNTLASNSKTYTYLIAEYTYDNIQFTIKPKSGADETYRMLLNFNITQLFEVGRNNSITKIIGETGKTSGEFIVTDEYGMIGGFDIVVEKKANLVISNGEIFYSNGTLFFGREDAKKLYTDYFNNYIINLFSETLLDYIDKGIADKNFALVLYELMSYNDAGVADGASADSVEKYFSDYAKLNIIAETNGIWNNESHEKWSTIVNNALGLTMEMNANQKKAQIIKWAGALGVAEDNNGDDVWDSGDSIKYGNIEAKKDDIFNTYNIDEIQIGKMKATNLNEFTEFLVAGFGALEYRAGLASLIREYGESYYTTEEKINAPTSPEAGPTKEGTIKFYNPNNQALSEVKYDNDSRVSNNSITLRVAVVCGANNSQNVSYVSILDSDKTKAMDEEGFATDPISQFIYNGLDSTVGIKNNFTEENWKKRNIAYYDVIYEFSYDEYKLGETNVVATLGLTIDKVRIEYKDISGNDYAKGLSKPLLRIRNSGIYSDALGKYILTPEGASQYIINNIQAVNDKAVVNGKFSYLDAGSEPKVAKTIDNLKGTKLGSITAQATTIEPRSEYDNFYTYFMRGNLTWTMLFDFCIHLPTIEFSPKLDFDFAFRFRLGTAYNYAEKVVWRMQAGQFYLDYNFRSAVGIGMANIYRMSSINPFILVFSTVLVMSILWTAIWGLIKRIYEVVILFIMLPAVCSTMPMDEGARFGKWQKELIEKIFSAYSVLIMLNLYFVLIPIVKDVTSDLITLDDIPNTITGMFGTISAGIQSFGGWISGLGAKLTGAITNFGGKLGGVMGNIGLSSWLLDSDLTNAQQALLGHVNSIIYLMFFLVLTTLLKNGKGIIEDILDLGKLDEDVQKDVLTNVKAVRESPMVQLPKQAIKGTAKLVGSGIALAAGGPGAAKMFNRFTSGPTTPPSSPDSSAPPPMGGGPAPIASPSTPAGGRPTPTPSSPSTGIEPASFDEGQTLEAPEYDEVPEIEAPFVAGGLSAPSFTPASFDDMSSQDDHGHVEEDDVYNDVKGLYDNKSDEEIEKEINEFNQLRDEEIAKIAQKKPEKGVLPEDMEILSYEEYQKSVEDNQIQLDKAKEELDNLDKERQELQKSGKFEGQAKSDWETKNNAASEAKNNATNELTKLKQAEYAYVDIKDEQDKIAKEYEEHINKAQHYMNIRQQNKQADASLNIALEREEKEREGFTNEEIKHLDELYKERASFREMKGMIDDTYQGEDREKAHAEVDTEINRINDEINVFMADTIARVQRDSVSNVQSTKHAETAETSQNATTAGEVKEEKKDSGLNIEQLNDQLRMAREDIHASKFASEEDRQRTIKELEDEIVHLASEQGTQAEIERNAEHTKKFNELTENGTINNVEEGNMGLTNAQNDDFERRLLWSSQGIKGEKSVEKLKEMSSKELKELFDKKIAASERAIEKAKTNKSISDEEIARKQKNIDKYKEVFDSVVGYQKSREAYQANNANSKPNDKPEQQKPVENVKANTNLGKSGTDVKAGTNVATAVSGVESNVSAKTQQANDKEESDKKKNEPTAVVPLDTSQTTAVTQSEEKGPKINIDFSQPIEQKQSDKKKVKLTDKQKQGLKNAGALAAASLVIPPPIVLAAYGGTLLYKKTQKPIKKVKEGLRQNPRAEKFAKNAALFLAAGPVGMGVYAVGKKVNEHIKKKKDREQDSKIAKVSASDGEQDERINELEDKIDELEKKVDSMKNSAKPKEEQKSEKSSKPEAKKNALKSTTKLSDEEIKKQGWSGDKRSKVLPKQEKITKQIAQPEPKKKETPSLPKPNEEKRTKSEESRFEKIIDKKLKEIKKQNEGNNVVSEATTKTNNSAKNEVPKSAPQKTEKKPEAKSQNKDNADKK